MMIRRERPRARFRRGRPALLYRCTLRGGGGPYVAQFYNDCGTLGCDDTDSVPPCPGAGVLGAGSGVFAAPDG